MGSERNQRRGGAGRRERRERQRRERLFSSLSLCSALLVLPLFLLPPSLPPPFCSSSSYSFAFGLAAARMLCVFSATAIDPWILSLRVRNIVWGDAPPTSLAKSASAITSVTSGLSSGAPWVTFFSFPGRSSRAHLVPSMSKTIRP